MDSDENVGYQFSINQTEPNWSSNSKTKNSISAVWFSKNRLPQFGNGFSHCSSMTGILDLKNVAVVHLFQYDYRAVHHSILNNRQPLLARETETNKTVIKHWKAVSIESMHIKQHTVQKPKQKNCSEFSKTNTELKTAVLCQLHISMSACV